MRIGLFDSGIGGLTVLKSLINKYPDNDYIYLGDTLNVPYGTKTKEELLTLARNDIEFLLKQDVEMIIVACGTVSSNCLQELKQEYDIPILSVVEPTINYLNNSNYSNIGVIATPSTINSHMFKNKVRKAVYEIAAPKLVPLIEHSENEKIKAVVEEYLNDYIDRIDSLVLGCTHYPLISDTFNEVLGNNTPLINMGELIKIPNNGNKELYVYFSHLDDKVINNTRRILPNKDLTLNLKK